jgi:hypothetical protein
MSFVEERKRRADVFTVSTERPGKDPDEDKIAGVGRVS